MKATRVEQQRRNFDMGGNIIGVKTLNNSKKTKWDHYRAKSNSNIVRKSILFLKLNYFILKIPHLANVTFWIVCVIEILFYKIYNVIIWLLNLDNWPWKHVPDIQTSRIEQGNSRLSYEHLIFLKACIELLRTSIHRVEIKISFLNNWSVFAFGFGFFPPFYAILLEVTNGSDLEVYLLLVLDFFLLFYYSNLLEVTSDFVYKIIRAYVRRIVE